MFVDAKRENARALLARWRRLQERIAALAINEKDQAAEEEFLWEEAKRLAQTLDAQFKDDLSSA